MEVLLAGARIDVSVFEVEHLLGVRPRGARQRAAVGHAVIGEPASPVRPHRHGKAAWLPQQRPDMAGDDLRDLACLVFCAFVGVLIIGVLATAAFGSLVTYWPYNLTPTLSHYDFNAIDPNGWGAFANSLIFCSS